MMNRNRKTIIPITVSIFLICMTGLLISYSVSKNNSTGQSAGARDSENQSGTYGNNAGNTGFSGKTGTSGNTEAFGSHTASSANTYDAATSLVSEEEIFDYNFADDLISPDSVRSVAREYKYDIEDSSRDKTDDYTSQTYLFSKTGSQGTIKLIMLTAVADEKKASSGRSDTPAQRDAGANDREDNRNVQTLIPQDIIEGMYRDELSQTGYEKFPNPVVMLVPGSNGDKLYYAAMHDDDGILVITTDDEQECRDIAGEFGLVYETGTDSYDSITYGEAPVLPGEGVLTIDELQYRSVAAYFGVIDDVKVSMENGRMVGGDLMDGSSISHATVTPRYVRATYEELQDAYGAQGKNPCVFRSNGAYMVIAYDEFGDIIMVSAPTPGRLKDICRYFGIIITF